MTVVEVAQQIRRDAQALVKQYLHAMDSTVGLAETPSPLTNQGSTTAPLSVMTLNLQYFASFPQDEALASQRLRELTGGVDIICVQEGLCGVDVLKAAAFELCICAGEKGQAQSVRDMVYGDGAALGACPEGIRSKLLCNQIYIRRGSPWRVGAVGCEQISSDLCLTGGCGRAKGPLALRTMVWVRLQHHDAHRPAVYVMCVHLSGGRFEDQYFVQDLAAERHRQIERCTAFFSERRPYAEASDVGVLVGDFNATTTYTSNGTMSSYFKAGIAVSEGVAEDARIAQVQMGTELEGLFEAYMLSPFTALDHLGWTLAYGEELGVTSAFGHLIDHMALSRNLLVENAEVVYLTNQKLGNKAADTDLPLTDHNAVKIVLSL